MYKYKYIYIYYITLYYKIFVIRFNQIIYSNVSENNPECIISKKSYKADSLDNPTDEEV